MNWRLWAVLIAVCAMLSCGGPHPVPHTKSRFTYLSTEYVDDSSSEVRILKDTATGVCYALWAYHVGGANGAVAALGHVPCTNPGGPHAEP